MADFFRRLGLISLSKLSRARSFSTENLTPEGPLQHLQRNAKAYSLLAAPFGLVLAFGYNTRAELRADIYRIEDTMRADSRAFKAELRADIGRVEETMRADMQAFKAELRADIGRVEVGLQQLHKDVGELKGLMTAKAS